VGLCIVSAVLAATFPKFFVVDLLGGIAFTLQGIWFYQIAFTFYGPMMLVRCGIDDHTIVCYSKEFEIRGTLLMTPERQRAIWAIYGNLAFQMAWKSKA